ncbi:biotin carboxylase [Nocardia tenerifensis]|uniref:Biotin carboxylase n=1 Tax=Nocardia tenerifensis TaxID=228006 RepID=A0A318JR48_9NOCA|nr:ATP-grasp domain-containing protein [Nocardia tenerifensis]PXX58144.1 biotin carboxylase [Nocardia tenerifensis]
MIRHYLLIGGARDVTPILRKRRPDLRITAMVAVPRLRRMLHPGECARVLALDDRAATDEWVALARAVHEREPIHAVGAFGEYDQRRAAAIADAFGMPFHAPSVIDRVYDKTLMRQRLREQGVDDTPAAPIDSPQDLKHFADEFGLPLILKPRSGSGSENIVRVSSAAELDAALAQLDGDRLVERYLEGTEISVEAFSENGIHRVVGITRKFIDADFVEIGHGVREATAADEPVADYVCSVLDALGIAFGPTHTEVIRTADGPRIVETHTRAGGDQIPQLLRAATGIDLVELAVRQSLGERVLPVLDALLAEPGRPSRAGAIRYRVPPASGRLVRVDHRDEAAAVEHVTGCTVLKEPGEPLVTPMRDSDDRVAFCTAVADDVETAGAAAELAVRRLEVVLE